MDLCRNVVRHLEYDLGLVCGWGNLLDYFQNFVYWNPLWNMNVCGNSVLFKAVNTFDLKKKKATLMVVLKEKSEGHQSRHD